MQYGVCMCQEGYHVVGNKCVIKDDKCRAIKLNACQESCNELTGEITNKADGIPCKIDEENGFCSAGICTPCPQNAASCDENGVIECKEGYTLDQTKCCPDGTFYNGEKCTSDCWDQNMFIESIIEPSTLYFSKCNQLCGTGEYYSYDYKKTDCERGPIGEGACKSLPPIRNQEYSATDDAKAARYLGLLDNNGNPILLGEEEALRLTQNMVWYQGGFYYYDSASICDAVGMHLASIDDIGCEEREDKSSSDTKCKKNGVGSKIMQAIVSVYLHGSSSNIPSFISGTQDGCVPAHIWLNKAELNYFSATSFNVSEQTSLAYTLCVK